MPWPDLLLDSKSGRIFPYRCNVKLSYIVISEKEPETVYWNFSLFLSIVTDCVIFEGLPVGDVPIWREIKTRKILPQMECRNPLKYKGFVTPEKSFHSFRTSNLGLLA